MYSVNSKAFQLLIWHFLLSSVFRLLWWSLLFSTKLRHHKIMWRRQNLRRKTSRNFKHALRIWMKPLLFHLEDKLNTLMTVFYINSLPKLKILKMVLILFKVKSRTRHQIHKVWCHFSQQEMKLNQAKKIQKCFRSFKTRSLPSILTGVLSKQLTSESKV